MKIEYIDPRELMKRVNFLITNPELAVEWNYEKNGDLVPGGFFPNSHRKVWWKCPEGHEYELDLIYRTKYNIGCPFCRKKRKKRE